MVSSVGNAPFFSYANQLAGIQSPTAPADTSDATSSAGATPAASAPAATPATSDSSASSLVSSLLGGGTGGFSPEVLSLLQQNSSGNFDPVTSLLGGTTTNNALTSLLSNLYTNATAATLGQAQQNGTTQAAIQTAPTSPVENLITAQTQASIAYNQTNLQNIQNAVATNSYQANGVTPLVA